MWDFTGRHTGLMTDRARWEPPRWSVRSRILTSILLVTALGMAVAGGTAYLFQHERALIEIDDRLVSRIEAARLVVTGDTSTVNSPSEGSSTVAAEPQGVDVTSPRTALEAVLSRVIPGQNESSLGIVDGAPTFIPGVELDFHLEDDPALVARVVSEVSDGTVRIGTSVGPLGTLRYIATPIEVPGSAESAVFMSAVDVTAELAELNSSFTTYAVVALGSLVVIGLVGWFVAGRLLRPIRQLRRAASRISASELDERIPVSGNDDVSDLTVTVNDMLDRIEHALTSQRQLLDDVRHELMTPITILRGNLELLDVRNVREVTATRSMALDELDRMTGLVNDIESLVDTQHAALRLVPVDTADLISDIFTKVCGIVGPRWVLGETVQTIVTVDPARVTQAILQLADNAAKYSPEGSVVELGCSAFDGAVQFWVRDSGPGIPEEARERIFERFGRVDAGRGIRGSGLGLPIVAALAEAHGGYVSLETGPGGSTFGIVLPVAAATGVR